ncbi:Uncharacterised protein [Serratia quinivorans]|uniref:hypothetical protein n=1 Tax=Serratia quinivorans TaxID=137545 RepID=UPI0021786F21|nr:hypothetical protein [Serratia quinivorans]CAI1627226.1 Uncharacterised protein [Serratia quinivorans]
MNKRKLVKNKGIKKTTRNPRQQFNAHCQAIKKQQLRIDTLLQQQADLMTQFQQQVLPLEKQYIETVYQKTVRLLSFSEKKTLAAYQREDLIEWITEEIMHMEDYPFAEHLDIQALKDQLFTACSLPEHKSLDQEQLGMMREILACDFPFASQLSDEELLDLMRDPEKFKARAEQEFSGNPPPGTEDDEEYIEDEDDFFFDNDEQESINEQEQQQKITQLFSTSAVNHMYKRLAILFHPDREIDEAAKKDKHDLMVQLAQAKKNHDIWTILNLYLTHIDPKGGIEEKDLPTTNLLLAEQIEALKIKYRQLEYAGDPLTVLVWTKFGAGSAAAQSVEKKLARHTKELQNSIKEERLILTELTSLKVLKQHLAERAEENNYDFDFLSKVLKKL